MENVSTMSSVAYAQQNTGLDSIAPKSELLASMSINLKWKNKEVPSRIIASNVFGLNESEHQGLRDICSKFSVLEPRHALSHNFVDVL